MIIRERIPECPECKGEGKHIVFGSKCRCQTAKEIYKQITNNSLEKKIIRKDQP